jgi:hypothetical protein
MKEWGGDGNTDDENDNDSAQTSNTSEDENENTNEDITGTADDNDDSTPLETYVDGLEAELDAEIAGLDSSYNPDNNTDDDSSNNPDLIDSAETSDYNNQPVNKQRQTWMHR